MTSLARKITRGASKKQFPISISSVIVVEKEFMIISPYHYGLQYLNLLVPLGMGISPTVVRVEDYQNPGPKWKVKIPPDSPWWTVRGRFNQHIKEHGRMLYGKPVPDSFEEDHVRLVHTGGGSPSQIRTVLQLVHLYWKELGLNLGPTPDLQKYVDKYIGLYCTGFVGNFTSEILGASNKGPSTPIDQFAPQGSRRLSPKDVLKHDVLVWKDGGHIAIINEILGELTITSGVMLVVESGLDGSYRGLTVGQENRYRMKKQQGDVFIVTRGLLSAAAVGSVAGVAGGVEVYIASAFV